MTRLDKQLICEFCDVLADEIMLRTLGAGEIKVADYHEAVNAAFAKATLEPVFWREGEVGHPDNPVSGYEKLIEPMPT